MNTAQQEALRAWFDTYVQGFYTGPARHDAHIQLKQVHTQKVCEEMEYLCTALALDEPDHLLAGAIALLHDVGRFEQYRRHQTFMDARSEDHCLLGLEIIKAQGVLDGFEASERDVILTAVRHHGARVLPDGLPKRTDLFCRLIRDADKIDIFRVVLDNYRRWKESPEGFVLAVPFPDEDRYNPALLDAVIEGQAIDYRELQTIHDVRLLQLGWIHDINFPATLARIRQRGHFDELLDGLPADDACDRLRRYVTQYVEQRLAAEDDNDRLRWKPPPNA
jgi:putative nucleotidyltransferase with HDIG domain